MSYFVINSCYINNQEIVERTERIRFRYNISREALGRSILGISGLVLGRLLRCPEPWDTQSKEMQSRYRQLAEWCDSFDPSAAHNRALMSQQVTKANGRGPDPGTKARYMSPVNTVRVARELRKRLDKHSVCSGFFADRKLGITKKFFEKLMSSRVEWAHIPDHVKRLYVKMKAWCECSDEVFVEFKELQTYANRRDKDSFTYFSCYHDGD